MSVYKEIFLCLLKGTIRKWHCISWGNGSNRTLAWDKSELAALFLLVVLSTEVPKCGMADIHVLHVCSRRYTYLTDYNRFCEPLSLYQSLCPCLCVRARTLHFFYFVLNTVSTVSRLYIGGLLFLALFIMFSCLSSNPLFKSNLLGLEVGTSLLQRI